MSAISTKNQNRTFLAARPRRAAFMCLGVAMVSLLNWLQIHAADDPSTPSTSLTIAAHAEDAAVEHCDVLVVGGTPSGVAAALAAARRGMKVVLIEERGHLGGDIYYGMLNMFDVPMKPGQASPVVYGVFAEFFERLGMSFSVDKARRLFEETVAAEPNIHSYRHTRVVRVVTEQDEVTSVVTSQLPVQSAPPAAKSSPVLRTFIPRVVIDATNDADLAARAGAGYYRGRENANPDKRMQSAGLLFSVSGVDWNAVRAYARSRRPVELTGTKTHESIDVEIARPGKKVPAPQPVEMRLRNAPRRSTPAANTSFKLEPVTKLNPEATPAPANPLAWLRLGGYYGDYVWERGDVIKDYKPRGPNMIALSINFGRQSDGTVVLNTLNIINVNGLSPTSMQRSRQEAMRELPHFIAYLRQRMPGFKNAKLAQVASELYIRETRHIHGFYTLKVEDIIGQKKFSDRVALVSYPLDLHPYTKHEHNPFGPKRYFYTLPFRALVPRGVNNVMVASRSLSATYSAAGSARVIPITMAAGEATGTAAWLCVKHNTTPHDMVENEEQITELREELLKWGVDVGDHCPRPAP